MPHCAGCGRMMWFSGNCSERFAVRHAMTADIPAPAQWPVASIFFLPLNARFPAELRLAYRLGLE